LRSLLHFLQLRCLDSRCSSFEKTTLSTLDPLNLDHLSFLGEEVCVYDPEDVRDVSGNVGGTRLVGVHREAGRNE
jgi:hypothetical protein